MFIEKVKNTIKRYRLLEKNDAVLAGVSGGADSVALLYALNALRKELNLTLHVAHLDHRLRPDSGKDSAFVGKLAAKLNLPATLATADVRKLRKRGSLEEAARTARLNFFFRIAEEIKADKIALGHNVDDQAETVLMRILRGAGLYGLSGILPKRKIRGCPVIRPLIEVKRREIEAYLKRRKAVFCRDSSNSSDIYFRNRIRNRLLPLLEKEYNTNIKEVLANMAQSVAGDYDYLNRVTERAAAGSGRNIKLSKLLKLHPAIRRLLIRRSISLVRGDTRRITFRHIKEIEDLILNRPAGSIVHLPRGISVLKKKNSLSFRIQRI